MAAQLLALPSPSALTSRYAGAREPAPPASFTGTPTSALQVAGRDHEGGKY